MTTPPVDQDAVRVILGGAIPFKPAEGRPSDTSDAKPSAEWPVFFPSTLQGAPVPERRFCVPDWIPDCKVTLLSGDGGTGKSLLALQLATCAAAGEPFLGMEIPRRKVLYFSAEDDQDDLHRRQVDICAALNIELADLEDRLAWRVVSGTSALLGEADKKGRIGTTKTYDGLRNYCRENGIQLLIVDTAADTFGGMEIDRQQVTRFIRNLEAIARDTQGAVVLIAHPSVSGLKDKSGISGSTSWRNAARSVIYLTRPEADPSAGQPDRDERRIERLKSNLAPAGATIALRYDRGLFVQDGGAFVETITELGRLFTENTVFNAIKVAIKAGKMPSPSKHSEMYVGTALRSFPGMHKITVKETERAVDRMIANGQLRQAQTGTGKNRRMLIVPHDHPTILDERDPATGAKKEASQ